MGGDFVSLFIYFCLDWDFCYIFVLVFVFGLIFLILFKKTLLDFSLYFPSLLKASHLTFIICVFSHCQGKKERM